MKQFTVPMALMDFIPVFFFAAAAIIMQRCFYNKMSKGAFALFAAGTIDVICAGGLKALYKLLYALNVCDFEPLTEMFFPVQSIGFMLAGLGIIAMFFHKQGTTALSVGPAIYKGTFLFVGMMIAGVACIDGGLIAVAKRMNKKSAIVCFVISFFFVLGMGYLSSKDFDKSSMNYIAQSVNIIGQGALFAGVKILQKAGLAEFDLKK